jgi:hypothetical protein
MARPGGFSEKVLKRFIERWVLEAESGFRQLIGHHRLADGQHLCAVTEQ